MEKVTLKLHVEEVANSITHGVGLLLSMLAGIAFVFSLPGTTIWHLIGFSVYALTLVLLYGASTGYHLMKDPRLKELFRIIDHASIYVFIAGSYTPMMLTLMRDQGGPLYISIAWILAFAGVVFKIYCTGKYMVLSTVSYFVTAGWISIVALTKLSSLMALPGIIWLVGGDLFYALGTFFFVKDEKKFFHAVWHCFVLMGSVCHLVCNYFFVLT